MPTEKLITEDPSANKAIDDLRGVASKIKAWADGGKQLTEDLESARKQVMALEQDMQDILADEETILTLVEAIEDHARQLKSDADLYHLADEVRTRRAG